MKKVLLFIVLAFSIALVACDNNGSNNTSVNGTEEITQLDNSSGIFGSTPLTRVTRDLPESEIPNISGYKKSGYYLSARNIFRQFFIYRGADDKIERVEIRNQDVDSRERGYGSIYVYNFKYSDGNVTITDIYYEESISGEEAKKVLQKLEDKTYILPYIIYIIDHI